MNEFFDGFEFFLDNIKKSDISRIFKDNISFPEFTQLKVIMYLMAKENKKSIQVSSLVERSHVTPQAVSKCLRVLEGKNYIERCTSKSDRRITEVIITDEGRKVFLNTHNIVRSVMKEIFSEFTKEEIEIYEQLTQKFFKLYLSAIDRRIKE